MFNPNNLNKINNISQLFNQFMQNPMGMLASRFNLAQNLNNPQEIIQHLLNTEQIKQEDVNQAMKMRNNPIFNMFKNLF